MPDSDPASRVVNLRKRTGFRVKPGMTQPCKMLLGNCDTASEAGIYCLFMP
jgi:hypothetical protein